MRPSSPLKLSSTRGLTFTCRKPLSWYRASILLTSFASRAWLKIPREKTRPAGWDEQHVAYGVALWLELLAGDRDLGFHKILLLVSLAQPAQGVVDELRTDRIPGMHMRDFEKLGMAIQRASLHRNLTHVCLHAGLHVKGDVYLLGRRIWFQSLAAGGRLVPALLPE